MREHRWETRRPVPFAQAMRAYRRLESLGLPVRPADRVGACYFDEFWTDRIEDLQRLDDWPVDEVTLIAVHEEWTGDFFVLAGRHHEVYRAHGAMEAYLSLSHPWRIPLTSEPAGHHREAMFWVGFRDTHGFIRVRVVPTSIVTPGDAPTMLTGHDHLVRERAEAFTAAIEALELPLFVERSRGATTVGAAEPECRIAGSWPDAFGPCQFEYVVPDRYELLVPAARLVQRLGARPAVLRTYLSGWKAEALQAFRRLQPGARLLHRGFVHACLNDVPGVVAAMAPRGRALATVCEWSTAEGLADGREAYAVISMIGGPEGCRFEVRLNLMPRSPEATGAWIEGLIGLPVQYAPLGWY